jgi:hypothetical protein
VALRTFVDAAGNEWQVFDVVPRTTERRSHDRRSPAEKKAEQDAERRDRDRRLSVGGRSAVHSSVTEGWLTFERGEDRRRLSPIPEGWQRADDSELDAYCRAARAVRRESVSMPRESQVESRKR